MDFDKFVLLNRFELIDIANNIGVKATYQKAGITHQKTKEELSQEIVDKFEKFHKDSDKYNFVKDICTTGRLVFFVFKFSFTTTYNKFVTPADYTIETSNGDFFYPTKIIDLPDGLFAYIPKSSNKIIVFKKDFSSNLSITQVENFAGKICKGMKLEVLFNPKMMQNIYKKVANNKLCTNVKSFDKIRFRAFYAYHSSDGDTLQISTKLSYGRARIGKQIKGLSSIDQGNIDVLVLNKKLVGGMSPNIIKYAIIDTPNEIIDTLKEIKVTILEDEKGKNNAKRYMLSIKKDEIKILNIDTKYTDLKHITDILLQLH